MNRHKVLQVNNNYMDKKNGGEWNDKLYEWFTYYCDEDVPYNALHTIVLGALQAERQRCDQELQKALRCGKDMGDGSICGCKLDCHLHDWRQRDELQKAREEERERWINYIEMRRNALRAYPYDSPSVGGADTCDEILQALHQSELDQPLPDKQ